MSRNSRGGMQANVARALGLTPLSDDTRPRHEAALCSCGTALEFDTNDIGQVIERCPICRRSKKHQGPRMLTRADKDAEYGVDAYGQHRRGRSSTDGTRFLRGKRDR